MSDVYSEKSYGSENVGFGEKLGILVVDFQNSVTGPRFTMGGSDRIDRSVKKTATLLKIAREKNIPVASCFVAYPNVDSMPSEGAGLDDFFCAGDIHSLTVECVAGVTHGRTCDSD